MPYRESGISPGQPYRQRYLAGIERVIADKRKDADAARAAYLDEIATNPDKCRAEFIQMLGWPLTASPGCIKTESRFVARDEDCAIYRVQMEILDGLPCYALLLLPAMAQAQPYPAVIVQHGGLGTPEMCANLCDTANYNDIARRIVRKGVAVLLPQLLLWDHANAGDSFDRIRIDASLKQLNGSITALEVFALMRWVDYLHTRDDVCAGHIGMTGLSYGGFYTLFTAAADTRIASAYASCFFNDRYRYGWPDWTWQGAAYRFLDTEVCALICPRPLRIEIGEADDIFSAESAKEEMQKLEAFRQSVNAPCLEFFIAPGGHEYSRTDEGIDFLLRHIGR